MFICYFIFITTQFNPFGINYSPLKRPYGGGSSGAACSEIAAALIEYVLFLYFLHFLTMICCNIDSLVFFPPSS